MTFRVAVSLVIMGFSTHCVSSAVASSSFSLTINSPTERQVIQRTALGVGVVTVSGTVASSADLIEVAVHDEHSDTAIIPWRKIGKGISFQYNLTLPQGGWYRLFVRAWRGVVNVVVPIEQVGVGDVYIVAGQSNACNSGETQFMANDLVSAWNGAGWHVANDPQPGPVWNGTAGSVWPLVGNSLVEQEKMPIAFVNVAVPGTRISEWVPQAKLYYPNLKTALQTLGKGGTRAVLWDQGEADTECQTSYTTYKNSLKTIINKSRADAGYKVPWLIAKASYPGLNGNAKHIATELSHQKSIQNAQTSLIDHKFTFAGPDTDTLASGAVISPFRRPPTFVHFSTFGQESAATLWVEAILAAFASTKPIHVGK